MYSLLTTSLGVTSRFNYLRQRQNPSNKVLRWALFIKQNLRFGQFWDCLASLELMKFLYYFDLYQNSHQLTRSHNNRLRL